MTLICGKINAITPLWFNSMETNFRFCSVTIFGFLEFLWVGLFHVQYGDYFWNATIYQFKTRLRRNFWRILVLGVLNCKENKEVGTICFEVRIPKKKTKIVMEFFYVSFSKWLFIFGFYNFILEANKNIYGNAFITWKSH